MNLQKSLQNALIICLLSHNDYSRNVLSEFLSLYFSFTKSNFMESQPTLQNEIVKGSKSAMRFGLLVLVIGIIAMVYPFGFGKFTVIIIGSFLIIGGILRIIFAILSPTMGGMIWRYLYALLMIFAGGYLISNPDSGLEALALAMALYFIIDGITNAFYSFSLMPIGGGFYLLFCGIISILLGALIFSKWPESSTYIIGIYLGIKLALDGLGLFLAGQSVKKAASA